LTDLGYDVVGNAPGEFATSLQADYARIGEIIKAADIRVNP
jgi:hypothetical protein